MDIEALLQIAQKQLQAAKRVLVLSHLRPDGDAVGSLLGLGLSLMEIGKDVQMVLVDGVPSNFRHLPGSDQVRNQPDGEFDLIVAVDCSDLQRIGDTLIGSSIPDINIDHHPTNLQFAHLNLVDVQAVATAEMLAKYLPRLSLPVTQPVATALLNGLITDTLGFRTYNMTSKALRVAADLMDFGVDLPDLYQRALLSRSFESVLYWGTGLSNLRRHGGLIWTSLSLADRQAVGYHGRDDADLVNLLTTIENVAVVVVFVQQNAGRVKVSWRSRPDFDVSQVALQFGGGGHKAASGAEVEGSMEQVQTQVLKATLQLFDNNYL